MPANARLCPLTPVYARLEYSASLADYSADLTE
jgi:hypothetical protein